VPTTQSLSENMIQNIGGVIQCSLPNADLHDFDANLDEKTPLGNEQLLLQGTFLKSTEWIYAVVVYTGNETKIGNNKQKPKIKWTRIDYFINRIVVFIFLLQLAIGSALGITGNVLSSTINEVR
jgi:magnesium-transporting ATPase (P-type)